MGMKSKSVGTDFEHTFKNSVPKNLMCMKLKDTPAPYSFSSNPSDYIVYDGKLLYFIECKSVKGKSISLSIISSGQYTKLASMCCKHNVLGGWLVNYREVNQTYFLPIQNLLNWKINNQKKSINISDMEAIGILVVSTLMRVHYKLDVQDLLNNLEVYHGRIFDK